MTLSIFKNEFFFLFSLKTVVNMEIWRLNKIIVKVQLFKKVMIYCVSHPEQSSQIQGNKFIENGSFPQFITKIMSKVKKFCY